MKKSPAWIFKTLFTIAVSGTVLGTFAAGGVMWYFSRDLPKIITVADYRPPGVTRVIAVGPPSAPAPSPAPHAGTGAKAEPDGGTVIGEFFGNERRYVIPFEKIPEIVINAFTSAEDDQFFAHSGINLVSILRASIANLRAGHVVQGGSTITQQVAKSLVLTSERSFVRKIKEVIVASRIERNLSKQQILYLYLNQIYLGHRAYGVQAAARTYFRKDISEVNIAEAALLAGLPQAPSQYNPVQNPKGAKERQNYVLRRMFESKFITQAQMNEAMALPIRIYRDENVNTRYSAYWMEHLRRYLVERYGEKAVYESAMTVTVPSSAELMRSASENLKEGLRSVDKRQGYRGPRAHLKTTDEQEKFLRQVRQGLIQRAVGFELLTSEGKFDTAAAMTSLGIKAEFQLLKPGQIYEALVMSPNDKKKSTSVVIGAVAAELPAEKMKWARASTPGRGDPSLPSRVFSKGDVVLVRVEEASEQGTIVSLEQEPEVEGAVFSMDAQTGFVLAMEGGFDFSRSEFNRAVQAQRQAGSAFKPIIYSAALERGYTPATIIIDSPLVYEDGDSGKWKPANFDERFYGDTTFRQALIKSRNVPTIKLVQSIEVPRVIDYAKRLGLASQFPMDLSISLGSATVSLVDLTKTYALYPRLGRRVTPIFYGKIMDRDGQVLEEQKSQAANYRTADLHPAASESKTPSPEASPSALLETLGAYPLAGDPDQVLDPRVAYVMTHLMKEVVTHGTGYEAKNLGRTAAGKTGTTNDFIDAWFIGFTPRVVTGVWVGYDGSRTMGKGETGAKAALPVWLSFMKEAVKSYPADDFPVPPGVVFASIDPQSGKLAAPNASKSINEAFIEGTEPKETAVNGRVNFDTSTDSEFFKEDID